MGPKKKRGLGAREMKEFLNQLVLDKPLLPFVLPLLFVLWGIEKWFFSLSNWVPLVVAVWAALQYGNYQQQIVVEDLKKRWNREILQKSPITPLEHCEWLNKLLAEVWPNYMGPKLSSRFSSMVERRLKHRKPKLIEKIELQEFSLGTCPPILGLHGTQWTSSGDQRTMRLGFDWDTTEISILLFAKLARPLMGTARIVINSIHIKGDLLLTPILDGRAVLYSFLSTPEVRVGVAFGSGGGQSLPGTELPGVSSWLVKVFTDTINKRMVEPSRNCLALPAVDKSKRAVGGTLHVTVISASKLSRSNLNGSPSRKQQSAVKDGYTENGLDNKELQTFVEIELEELSRRTDLKTGASPIWNSNHNLVLHDNAGTIRFSIYHCNPESIKYDFLTSCEIKMRYVADDSTIFWATGINSSVIAKRTENFGEAIEMTVPLEGDNSGELTVKLILKEWQFSDGLHSMNLSKSGLHQPLNAMSSILPITGRKILITILEGKNLIMKDKFGKSGPYVKLKYGKVIQRTITVSRASDAKWDQRFEFDEIDGGEYMKIKCYIEETFGDECIGSARVNLEGLVEGSTRDVWIPLEKTNSGELHLLLEAVTVDHEESKGQGRSANGWIELVLIEARDLVAADRRGTSDPYVRIHYGNLKRRSKVIYKTLSPKWHQTFEFPEDGSSLVLYVKDHNNVLASSSIGECVVEYQRLPPNHMSDKWIPLQNVKNGEIHVQVTRKIPEVEKKPPDSESSSAKGRQQNSMRMKQLMRKFHSMIEDGSLEDLSASMGELENLQDVQEEYIIQLETEQEILLSKINEIGQEILNSSPPLTRTTTIP